MNISVVIPAFNAEAFIRESVLSAASQPIVRDVIIVDDGSYDNTAVIAAELSSIYEQVRVLTQANMGVSAARNAGMMLSKSPYICFLDADDRLIPGALEMLASQLNDNPEAVGAYGRLNYIDSDSIIVTGSTPSKTNATPRLYLKDVLQSNFIDTPGALLLRKSVVISVGGFNESLSYGEDWELYVRLACKGSFVAIPSYVAEYRLHNNSAMSRFDRSKHVKAAEAVFGGAHVLSRFKSSELGLLRLRHDANALRVAALKCRGAAAQFRNLRQLMSIVAASKGDRMVTQTAFRGVASAIKRAFLST